MRVDSVQRMDIIDSTIRRQWANNKTHRGNSSVAGSRNFFIAMAITKIQKTDIIEKGNTDLEKANALIFTDFTGTSVSDLGELRTSLRENDSKFKVIKKRLLKIVLGSKNIDVDPVGFDGTLGTVFVKGGLSEAAGSLYRFSKTHEKFKLLGAYDVSKKELLSAADINAIGSLPPRSELLGQVVGAIAGPLRALMYILSEKSKKA